MNRDKYDKVKSDLLSLDSIMDDITNLQNDLNRLIKFKDAINPNLQDTVSIEISNRNNDSSLILDSYDIEGLRDEFFKVAEEKIKLQIEKLKNEGKVYQNRIDESAKQII